MALKMIHPEIETVAVCATETSFAEVWEPRGWELLGEAESFACDTLDRSVKSLDDLSAADLLELTAVRGAEPKGKKVADLKKAYVESFGVQNTNADAPAPQNQE